MLDLDAPQLKGITTITAKPAIAAVHGIDLEALGRSELGIEIEAVVGAGPRVAGAARSRPRRSRRATARRNSRDRLTGAWRAPLRLKAKMSGAGSRCRRARARPSRGRRSPRPTSTSQVRSVNLAPLLDLKPSDALAQNISLSSRVSLAGNKLTFDDLDSTIAGSRLRGHAGVDALTTKRTSRAKSASTRSTLAPAFALAIGAAGHDAAEPLGAGLTEGLARPRRVSGAARSRCRAAANCSR